MDDLNKLLDGSIDDVKARLDGVSHDNLLKLKDAEQANEKRKAVLTAIDAAISKADAKRAGGTETTVAATGSGAGGIVADLDSSGPAGIDPADAIDTSGAPQQIVPDVDLDHPAVDRDPRAGTTETMNRIDFNDPSKSGQEVVEEQLKARDGK